MKLADRVGGLLRLDAARRGRRPAAIVALNRLCSPGSAGCSVADVLALVQDLAAVAAVLDAGGSRAPGEAFADRATSSIGVSMPAERFDARRGVLAVGDDQAVRRARARRMRNDATISSMSL